MKTYEEIFNLIDKCLDQRKSFSSGWLEWMYCEISKFTGLSVKVIERWDLYNCGQFDYHSKFALHLFEEINKIKSV